MHFESLLGLRVATRANVEHDGFPELPKLQRGKTNEGNHEYGRPGPPKRDVDMDRPEPTTGRMVGPDRGHAP